ncbi:MAG: NFACT family protein [Nanoarchaeota archaeon]|nr:NFACT family protein [Nanoarchaeota archaeon]MBU1135340.1 NFACT family protein [Nanoarchaeota archaeon]MBU2519704.1 NFACT family protein [Nanoarchaeota archaeon]
MATKEQMSALDFRFLTREFQRTIIGGVFRKIFQYDRSKKQFLFGIWVPQRGEYLLYSDKSKMFLTHQKSSIPVEPPSFCMFLRKHLMGKRIKDVKQHDFERIVEIHTDENIIIFELFSHGNIILCDASLNIIMPLEMQRWKDREIRPKVPYKYPPRIMNVFSMSFDDFKNVAIATEKPIISVLATSFGLGPVYAKEICYRTDIDEKREGSKLNLNDLLKLYKLINDLDKMKGATSHGLTVSPFELKTDEEGLLKSFGSFSEALDDFYSDEIIETEKKEIEKKIEEEKQKVERIVEQQEVAEEKFEKIQEESRGTADLIYNYYGTVDGVLNGIRQAHENGVTWAEIKQRVKSENTPEAEAIVEIREHDGTVVVELGGHEVELDFRKSVEENAADYYEDAKWAKKKSDRMEEHKERTAEQLKEVEKKEEEAKYFTDIGSEEETEEKKEKKQKKKWYEAYKWFISTQGFIVIAGRNATQNENIVKKRAEDNDLVFHADIVGAAFTVIKADGNQIPVETVKEAAEFAAAHSKAWARGLGTIDVFYVPRTQVSKSPPSGTYLPKGSFMIDGEREWFRDIEVKLAIGIQIDREENIYKVISGPVISVRKNSNYFVTIRPGFKKALDLARTIRNKLLIKCKPEDRVHIETIPLEEFEKMIPGGMGDVVESAQDF